MSGLIAGCLHAVAAGAFGWAVLGLLGGRRTLVEQAVAAFLLGMALETMALFALMWAGLPLPAAMLAFAGVAVAVIALALRRGRMQGGRIRGVRTAWYEWALWICLGEKVLFAVAMMHLYPVINEDALAQWSGRGRALYGGVNWSFDPDSPVFMSHTIWPNYPLLIPIWRAATAVVNGGWDDVAARFDGAPLLVAVVLTVWTAVLRMGGGRWPAAIAALLVCAVPLQAWHAHAGDADIAVEAFTVAAVAALLRGEWAVAGLMAGATAWSKSEGWVIHGPVLILGAAVMQVTNAADLRRIRTWPNALRSIWPMWTALLLFIAPWLMFRAVTGLALSPPGTEGHLGWRPDAPWRIWRQLVSQPANGFFWVFALVGALVGFPRMTREPVGRGLLVIGWGGFGLVCAVFCFTEAYAWLENLTSINRFLMQLTAPLTVVVFYGLTKPPRAADCPE